MKVLAADRFILCRGLVRTLTLLREDVCVIAADSIDEVLVRISEVPDLDLVLLDAAMPGMENFAGLRQTVEKLPEVPVVVTSPNESHADIVAAIRNGAKGYFSLSTKPCVLEHALLLIMAGEYYIPASALRLWYQQAMLAPEQAPRMRTAADRLTPRQREIIIRLAEGGSNKEIAREFKVLEGTVKLHVRGILRRLGVRNRTEAVVAAARAGYLPILNTEQPTSKRTAADIFRKQSRPRGAALRPRSTTRSMDPGRAARKPRPGRPGCRQTEDWTMVTEGSSSGPPLAVSIGSVRNEQAEDITSAEAANAAPLSPKKSKHE